MKQARKTALKTADSPGKTSTPRSVPSLLTHPLGLEGWSRIEPVLLAALASEDPLLLIGRHGCAKSFLLERLAQALGLVYRFYNASLINFDDLVGIPIPDEQQKSLRYICTPASIWEAQVVFFDELNRTKPELQNKLFPIIHERRVQGIQLEQLRYRWAAMNPLVNPEEEEQYFGAEPLDPALADRFAFIIEVPTWQALTNPEKRRVLADQFRGPHSFATSPAELVKEAQRLLRALTQNPASLLREYLIFLESRLGESNYYLSTRRLTILHRNIYACHAARLALALKAESDPNLQKVDWNESAFLALRHGLPQLAQGLKLDHTALLAAHRQAWKTAGLDENDPWRSLLREADPIERLALALQLGPKVTSLDIGQLICEAVAAQTTEPKRTAVALAAYLAVCQIHAIPAPVLDTLSHHIEHVLRVARHEHEIWGPELSTHHRIGQICSTLTNDPAHPDYQRDSYTRNLLSGLISKRSRDLVPAELAEFFQGLWQKFQINRIGVPCST